MSTVSYIKLLRSENNPTYLKYRKIMEACKEAEIWPPEEVDKYFGGYGLDNSLEKPLEIEFEPTKGSYDCIDWLEIKLSDLPEGVEKIRFCTSY